MMKRVWISRLAQFGLLGTCLVLLGWVLPGTTSVARAQSVDPLMRLLKSGRLPGERAGNVVDLICRRGDADDLAYIFEQTISPEGFSGEVRTQALQGLADAALTRRVQPASDLSGLAQLIDPQQDRATQRVAIQLAGIWKVEALADQLQELALSEEAHSGQRQAALEALVTMGPQHSRAIIEKLTAKGQPQPLRYMGVAALTRLDLERAAELAAEVLAESGEKDDSGPAIQAFLDRQGGADKLAAALGENQPPADVAKLALRYMYSIGRSDPPLVAALSDAAGLHATAKLPDPHELQEMVAEVMAQGDPQRGERIFRREDLSCLKCHAVSGAGGNVGPDLSAIGSTSPVDFVIKEILVPDQAIKEGFVTTTVFTEDGRILQGIVVEKDEQRLVLRDATGKETLIPSDDVDELHEGGSLMPQGLANFLTRSEFIDLVRFVSELGKPGDYAIRTAPTLQRWRVLQPVPEPLTASVPDADALRELVLEAEEEAWHSAYGMVAGTLPLDEFPEAAEQGVLYLQGEVDVTRGGEVGFTLNSTAGTHLWVNDQPYESQERISVDLPRGRHAITLRIDTAEREDPGLKIEFFKVEGSEAEYTVVGGR